jgi:asparagine synthase (glutamine-hydrolysing)
VLYRPKMGFAVPLARWFRGPLKQRVRDAVLGERLLGTGWFEPAMLRSLVDQHQAGSHNHSAPLWTLLMFEAFLRNVVDGGGEPVKVPEGACLAEPAAPRRER